MREEKKTYPVLKVDLDAIRTNARVVCELCAGKGIEVAGVIKFSDGDLAEYIGQDAMVNILNADNAAGRLQDGLSVERYVKGLMIIACWGYPNYIPDGMSEDQARYATSAAMHAYTGVSVKSPLTQGFGYSFLGETDPVNRMRAKPNWIMASENWQQLPLLEY